MKLKEVFDQLTFGELSQIAIGGITDGEINENNYPNILAHVNLGLTGLYKRFNLKQGRLILLPQVGKTDYLLHSKFAVNGKRTTEPVRYIEDTVTSPFEDDILKIERVLTDDGVEFALNNLSDKYSVITPSSLVLRLPSPVADMDATVPIQYQTAKVHVVYRANHRRLDADTNASDPGNTEVELPYSHLEALLLFVASRVNNPIGMTNEFNAGNNYAAKYEMECQRLETAGLAIDQGSSGSKLRDRGFA
jgi:hypothetical protein